MSNQIKKPPISISELKNQGKPEPQKGNLSYVENRGNLGGTPSKSKVNLTQLALAVGLSILLFFVISNFMLASKKDATTLLDNQRVLETQQQATQGDLATQKGRIENVISSQATQDTQLASLSSSLNDLVNRISGFGSSIESLGGRVTTLEDRVTALGNQTALGGALDYYFTEDRFYVKVSKEGNYRFRFTLMAEEDSYDFGFIDDVLTYYSKNVELTASETYRSFGLTNLKTALSEFNQMKLSDYYIYVELLEGNEASGEAIEDNL